MPFTSFATTVGAYLDTGLLVIDPFSRQRYEHLVSYMIDIYSNNTIQSFSPSSLMI